MDMHTDELRSLWIPPLGNRMSISVTHMPSTQVHT
jgi:hypothetical protein